MSTLPEDCKREDCMYSELELRTRLVFLMLWLESTLKPDLHFNPPGAPGQPRDLTSTSDSTILGYYIERVQGGSWPKECHAVVKDLSQRVTGLQENMVYEDVLPTS